MFYIKLALFALMGALLAQAHVLAARDWEFYAIIGCAALIGVVSKRESR